MERVEDKGPLRSGPLSFSAAVLRPFARILSAHLFPCDRSTTPPPYTTAGNKGSATATSGQQSSIAFVESETMRALGDVKGEPEERWSDYRGWVFGAQIRFVAQALRSKGIGAVIDAKVPTGE